MWRRYPIISNLKSTPEQIENAPVNVARYGDSTVIVEIKVWESSDMIGHQREEWMKELNRRLADILNTAGIVPPERKDIT